MDVAEGRSGIKLKRTKPFKFLHKKDEREERKDDRRKKDGKEKEDRKKEKRKEKEEKKKEKEERKRIKKDKKKKDSIFNEDRCPIFGVPLSTALERNPSHDGVPLPAVVRQCIDVVEEKGLCCEEIYKLGGMKNKVHALRKALDSGTEVVLEEQHPHVVAALLKQFFKDLPESILTKDMMTHFEDVSLIPNPHSRAESLRQLIEHLPTSNRILLQYMMKHMGNVIKKEKENKMSYQNVCIVLSPIMRISHRVLNVMFLSQDYLFKTVTIHKYVLPLSANQSCGRSVDELITCDEINKEIYRQESVLNFLHSSLSSGIASAKREEQLWEAQRIVTLLKRKLKVARQKDDSEKDSSSEDAKETGNNKGNYLPKESHQHISVTQLAPTDSPPEGSQPMQQSITEENVVISDDNVPDSSLERELLIVRAAEKQNEEIMEEAKNIPTSDLNLMEEIALFKLSHEELLKVNQALTKQIQRERKLISKLKEDIQEVQTLYAYRTHSYDSSESDEGESEGESDSEEDIRKEIFENSKIYEELKAENLLITRKIEEEKEKIVKLKVYLRFSALKGTLST